MAEMISTTAGFARSVDRCIQCGFCLTACPTYRLFDDEESSPRGRIALMASVATGELPANPVTLQTYSQCLGCRACESACPAGVIYEEVFLAGREALAEVTGPLPLDARALLFLIKSPFRLQVAQRLWRILGGAAVRLARFLPTLKPPFALLAAVPPPSSPSETMVSNPDIVIHRGCLMDIFWERTNARAAGLLIDAGMPAGLLAASAGCCGALHAHQGDVDTARALAKRVIRSFEEAGAATIVSLAGGCGAFMAEYPDLFEPADPWRDRADRLAAAVRDVSSLLRDSGYVPPEGDRAVTYQDSCHLRHGLKVWRQPRELLAASGGFHELRDADQCCGSAGIYNLLHPDVSDRLIDRKMADLAALDVDTIVVTNPGCELQVRLGVRRAGLSVQVRHLVDYLFELAPDASS